MSSDPRVSAGAARASSSTTDSAAASTKAGGPDTGHPPQSGQGKYQHVFDGRIWIESTTTPKVRWEIEAQRVTTSRMTPPHIETPPFIWGHFYVLFK